MSRHLDHGPAAGWSAFLSAVVEADTRLGGHRAPPKIKAARAARRAQAALARKEAKQKRPKL